MAETWEEITPEFHQFDKKGETLEGTLVSKDIITIRDVEVKRYTICRSLDGHHVAFLGGVLLDPVLDMVDIGTNIKLEFLGKVKTSGGTSVKTFKIYRAKAE